MNHVIAELQMKLDLYEHNEPIHRKEGNAEQADNCAQKAAEFRQALLILNASVNGPIWPKPTTVYTT